MALTTTQVQNISDSVANGISAFNTNFLTGTSAAVTAMNSGIGGTGASATLGRILALAAVPDLPDTLALLTKTNTVVSNVAAYLSGVTALNSFYLQYFPLLDAMDTQQSGLNAFLTTNALQVNAFFALAFNYYQTLAVNQNYRTTANIPVQIATANFFPYAVVDPMLTWTVTAATTLTPTPGSASSTQGGGIATIYIYKSNATAAIGGATFTITYTNAAGGSQTVQYTTAAGVPIASGSIGTNSVSLGVQASAVTAVTVTGGTASEAYGVGAKLVRTPGY